MKKLSCLLFIAALASAPDPLEGQSGEEFRMGITLGGIGLIGVDFEFRSGDHALDLNVATFDWNDLSISVVAKEYFGGGDVRPFVGLGLWTVVDFSSGPPGVALLARAPIGVDWRVNGGDHFAGLSVALNRALATWNPEDDTPINGRIVPLPALYYKYQN